MAQKSKTGDYGSMVWIRDKDGKQYACNIEDIRGKLKGEEELTPEEKAKCLDVSQIIGTERW